MSKKLQEKQARRLAAEQRKAAQKAAQRRGNLITIGIALMVVIVVVSLILRERGGGDGGPIGVAESRAGCSDIETYDEQGRDHVEEGTQIEYESIPPTSGPHYGNWADPGFYSSAMPPERLVHNLEHGQLVIWFDPAAPADVRDDIEAFVDDNPVAILAAPYDQVPEGNFTITAWGAAMSCEQLSEAALADFREEYQGRGPENVGIPQFSG